MNTPRASFICSKCSPTGNFFPPSPGETHCRICGEARTLVAETVTELYARKADTADDNRVFPPKLLAKNFVSQMTDEERVELFRQYCTRCGRPTPGSEVCHCSNDD